MLDSHMQIDIEDAIAQLDKDAIFIDVRTPSEFAQDSIPGAYNIPILTEEQRAEAGTIHKQQSASQARIRGMELISPRLPEIINPIRELHQKHKRLIIVFCWRGGLRSTAMTAFLHLCGVPVFQLKGGYKSFRRHVINYFEHASWARMLVLRGLTGVGKTRILEQLERGGWPILNLEALANHRGSAFGAIGCAQQPSQKQFEALLWNKMRHTSSADFILTEGESRHIGRVMLPKRLYATLQDETTLWLETDIQNRIRVISEDYAVDDLPAEAFAHALDSLIPRLGHERIRHMHQLLQRKDWGGLIEKLMLLYYDPLYAHTKPKTRIDIEIDPFAPEHPALMQAIDKLTKT